MRHDVFYQIQGGAVLRVHDKSSGKIQVHGGPVILRVPSQAAKAFSLLNDHKKERDIHNERSLALVIDAVLLQFKNVIRHLVLETIRRLQHHFLGALKDGLRVQFRILHADEESEGLPLAALLHLGQEFLDVDPNVWEQLEIGNIHPVAEGSVGFHSSHVFYG